MRVPPLPPPGAGAGVRATVSLVSYALRMRGYESWTEYGSVVGVPVDNPSAGA